MPNDQQSLILNVDDSEAMRYAKGRALTNAGFDVIEAATGKSALEIVEQSKPALLVLDVNLPDINGLTACRQVVQAHPEIKVIVFTAADDPDTRRRAFEAGACAVVDKVEFGGELLSTLRRLDSARH